ncbi:hypothetical protein EDB85DRAFT_2141334 [Lactarius pseudohatsudake]|nr:hypothetical protein EDB85DRAFT_2141334 [Lactarius pseudohatsudake]
MSLSRQAGISRAYNIRTESPDCIIDLAQILIIETLLRSITPREFTKKPRSIITNKTQFYLSQCADAASKSPMCFTLGAVLVKGGKVISSGYNHHRPHYDGAEVRTRGHRKPVSMHAEMHAIFSLTGMSPSFRKQQGARAGALQTPFPSQRPLPPPAPALPPARLFKGMAPFAACEGHLRNLSWWIDSEGTPFIDTNCAP